MATLPPSPPFSPLPEETNYDYRPAAPEAPAEEGRLDRRVRRSASRLRRRLRLVAQQRGRAYRRDGSDREERQDRRVRPLLSGWGDYREYTRYSPSILVLSDNSARLTQLTHWLESKGCQASGLNLNSTPLASVSQIYFDLIIVDLESFEQGGSKNVVRAACIPTERVGKTGASADEALFTLLQKLKAYPGLATLPTIILSNCDELRTSLTNSLGGPLYCLSKGPSTEAILLQIVAQIHYLSYRYI